MPTGVGATWGEDNVQQASGGTRSNEGNTGSTVLIHCGEQSCLIAFGGRGMFILRAGTACGDWRGGTDVTGHMLVEPATVEAGDLARCFA